jgi:uncharacterized membrane protein YhaH (DUF805 family)
VQWFLKVLRQYAEFSGRARRKEYWMFALVNILIIIALGSLGALAKTFSDSMESPAFGALGLYFLVVLIPSLAVTARRLHDIGKTGWWQLLGLVYPIPLVGWIAAIVMIVWCATEGNKGPNEYGPDPKDPSRQGPYPEGPHQQGPYSQSPYQQGAYQQGAYQQGPYQQGPYPQSPYQQGPYQQNPQQQGPYQQGPYQQGPYQQGPHRQGPHQQGPYPQNPHQ